MKKLTCAASAAILVATIAAAIYYRADIVALNQAGGWLAFAVTGGGCLVIAGALAVLLANLVPDEIWDALTRSWL